MQINLSFDTSVGNLSAADQVAFEAAMQAAAGVIGGIISNNITVTLAVGYGEDGGYGSNPPTLITDPTTLAEAAPIGEYLLYGPLRNALQNSSNLLAVNAAFAAVPATEPTAWGTANLYTSNAEIKALGGDLAPGSLEIDGDIGVSSTQNFDYDTTGAAVPAGEYSFMGVAEHELTHALGRFSNTPTLYTPLDLFRYASPATLAGLGGTPAYFSLDSGTTDINNYDTASDYSDWLGTINNVATLDSFNAFETPGTLLPISMSDRLELGALGFHINLGTVSWTGAVSDDFDGNGNWDAFQAPGASDEASIGGGSVTVQPTSVDEIDSLQIGAGAKLEIDSDHFVVDDANESSTNAGDVVVDASGGEASLYLAGTFDNSGLLELEADGADLLTNSTTVTIGGTGTIDMVNGAIGGRTFSDATPYDTLISTNLIHGSGVIGRDGFLNTLTFINKGTVRADDVLPLTINAAIVNEGLLDDASTQTDFVLTGDIDNTAGQITAEDGTTLQLTNATVTGGNVSALGTGKIEVAGDSTLDGSNPAGGGNPAGLALSGDVVVDAGAALTVGGVVSGGEINATNGQLDLLPTAKLTGVKMTGHIGFGGGGGGAILYAASYYDPTPTDIGGIDLSGELTLATNPDGTNGFANSGTFTVDKGGDLNILHTAVITGGVIEMTDTTSVITGTPGGGGGYPPYDWLLLDGATLTGVGIVTGLEIWSYSNSTIMANGGTLIVQSGPDFDYLNRPEETVSDGWIGAAAGSDLVIMGNLDLEPNIIDGSSPGGSLYGAGTITLGGSIITGAEAGTIVGGTIDAGRTIQVAAPGGGLDLTTNNGEVDVNAGALLTFFGDQDLTEADNPGTDTNNGLIVLNGALDSNSVYQAATLTTLGDVSVNGGGTIRLESNGGTGDDQIVSLANNDTLESAGTIDGVGTLGGSYLNLSNYGVVSADAAGHALVVDGGSLNSVAGQIYNNGLMQAANGGTLVVNSQILNYGLAYYGPTPEPAGGGDVGASGPNSVVLLNKGGITDGRLFTAGGGQIEVTGNFTLGGGAEFISEATATPLGNTDAIVNSNTTGRQSDGAVTGLTDGRMVVAWDDYSANANGPGTPDPVTGAILYPPIVRYAVLGTFGSKLTGGDLAVQPPPAGQQQSGPATAALPNGGFVITWLQSGLGGGGTTLQGVTYNADLSVADSGFSIPVAGSGSAAQDVAGMKDGGFAVVWADAASPGTASAIHLERFSKSGVGGTIVNIGSGVQPSIALAGNLSGAYAVTWTVPGAGNAEGTVYAQFFSAAGVVAGAPVTVATGNSAYIAPGQNGNAFVVFWNDLVNNPGILQGQEFQANGQLSDVGINTAAELDYGGLYTASSAALPDGRVATAQSLPRNGSTGYTDVGLQFSASHANTYALVSFANITVESGDTLTLQQGMGNSGTITLSSNGGAVLNASSSVALNGSGTIVLGSPTDQIGGATGADTLINDGNTIQGMGSIGGNNLSFDNLGIVSATSGTLIIGGGGMLTNNSTMKSAGGTLEINGPVLNEGYIQSTGANGKVVINGPVKDGSFYNGYLEVLGGEMDLNGSVDIYQNIYFASTGPALLVLSDPLQMKGTILFMNVGDTIDVTGVAASGYSYDENNGVLNLLSGTTTLAALGLQGTAYPGSLVVVSDNHGGTLVEFTSTKPLGNGANPAVAGLPGGGFVEIYQYVPYAGAAPEGIYGQLFDGKQNYAGSLYVDGAGQQPAVAAQRSGDFMVVWSNPTTNTIQGQIYAANGTLLKSTFDLTQAVEGWTQTYPSISVAPSSGSGEQYEFAYETDNASTNSHAIVVETLDANGAATAAPTIVTPSTVDILGVEYILNSPVTPRVVATKLTSPIQAVVFQAIAQVEGDPTEFNTVMGEFVVGVGSSGVRPAGTNAVSVTEDSANTVTIMFTPAGTNLTYVTPEIAALSNGDLVAVWDQIGPSDTTWTVAGQIVTSAGVFVGGRFTVATALPAASTPARPAIEALPNGDFVVVYSAAAGSLSGQKYDPSGNPLGNPFGVSNTSDGNPATTVLSDGTLLTVSGDGGVVNAGTFAVQPTGATWSGTNGTDLGAPANWQPVAVPDATETLTFGLSTGGTLTGSATGMNAVFSGAGAWLLQGAAVVLSGETISAGAVLALTENGALTMIGGSLTATGSLDVETAAGLAMTVEGAAQLSVDGISLGIGLGQSGVLAVAGSGTLIQNTGSSGSAEIGGSGSGQLTISGGAAVTDAAGATLGANTGGSGSLSVTGPGSSFSVTGELDVGVDGAGSLTIANQAAVASGSNAAAPAQGFDIGELSGGSGEATVTGSGALLQNIGRFIVGDAGLGGLSIDAGATVTTAPGSGTIGVVIANTASASGSSVNVVGGDLQVTDTLIDGEAGAGLLEIGPGGFVSADELDLGDEAGGSGVLTMEGSLTTTGALVVGASGAGELSLLTGASVTIGGDLDIGAASGSSGNVDVENTTGTLIIDGNLNVGVGGGVATMTIGLDTGVQLDNGGINQGKYSKVIAHTAFDPQYDNINGGGFELATGTNTFLAYFNNDDAGQVTQDASGDQSVLQVPTIYGSPSGGSFQINSGDASLTLNADGVSGQTFQFTDNTGTLVIGIDQLATIDVPASGTGPFTAEKNPNLGLHLIGGFGGTIASMVAGDAIVVDTTAAAHIFYPGSGTVVSVIDNAAGTQVGTLAFASAALAAEISVGSTSASQLELVACFAAGTRIGTADGWVKVEELRVGDRVRTVSERRGFDGGAAAPCEPIVWIGSRAVDCARHPKPETVWPVRVSAGAFGENVPERELYLSPDHAVFVNGVLVPVKLLINNSSITQVKRNRVTYYHVELPEHAIILAEGLTVESYLHTGDRANFDGAETIRLHPNFTARLTPDVATLWEAQGAAPLVMTGQELIDARRSVTENISRLGKAMTRMARFAR